MMRRSTGFHAHQTGGLLLEKPKQLASSQLSLDHRRAGPVDTVNLKYVLRDIQTDRANVHLGRLPYWRFQ